MPLSCRYYEHRYPEVDDVVMVNVRSIAEMGAYVHLLEYNNIEGMILLSELSRRRIRSINKLIRVGRNECVVVIRVDKDKGYIDLSKRRVVAEEVNKCLDKYAKAKAVSSILRHVADVLDYTTNEQLENLYMKTAWHFDKKLTKPGERSIPRAYDIFKHAVGNPELLDECDIDDETKAVLLENIKRRLTPQSVKVRADIEVSCFGYEGIDAVKAALWKGLSLSTEDMPIKICLIAPPLYVVTTQTIEREDGIEKLTSALALIQESIEESAGVFRVKMAPKAVTDTEEAELQKQMAQYEEENREISGDEDSEEGEDEGMGAVDDDGDDTKGKAKVENGDEEEEDEDDQ